MNDSELYNRVIKVDVAKPHRGAGGLDSSLPGTLPSLTLPSLFLLSLVLLSFAPCPLSLYRTAPPSPFAPSTFTHWHVDICLCWDGHLYGVWCITVIRSLRFPAFPASKTQANNPVWQQEEWIKANLTKDPVDGETPDDGAGIGAKELAAEAVSTKSEVNRRSMRGLEFAQEH